MKQILMEQRPVYCHIHNCEHTQFTDKTSLCIKCVKVYAKRFLPLAVVYLRRFEEKLPDAEYHRLIVCTENNPLTMLELMAVKAMKGNKTIPIVYDDILKSKSISSLLI